MGGQERKLMVRVRHLAVMAVISASTILAGTAQAYAFTPGGIARNGTQAQNRPGLFLTGRRETIPPFAFAKFCLQESDQCRAQGTETNVELTKEKRALLQRINSEINTKIAYSEDNGADDDWKINVIQGDCEDYALTKRQQLLKAGWPSGALRIATGRLENGVGHAVLIVSTTKGDLVLDNRTNVVKPWIATQLRWVKIQSPDDPNKWLSL
ncbi:transglutaminase-like cysteine peptidase [Agrobacterium sp. NPDC090273]|uniref:transglutaminase-like cysteine peptidase n=1 Tax=Agrobacterium sp. NPDC090273 TaxID=3363919 RepID=UPI00383A377D